MLQNLKAWSAAPPRLREQGETEPVPAALSSTSLSSQDGAEEWTHEVPPPDPWAVTVAPEAGTGRHVAPAPDDPIPDDLISDDPTADDPTADDREGPSAGGDEGATMVDLSEPEPVESAPPSWGAAPAPDAGSTGWPAQ